MSSIHSFDCVIIGGGPTGTAAASILARDHNRRVAIVEKSRFPRYRIGESMIPFCYYPLQRMGVLDAVKKARFTKKNSVKFISREGRESQPFYFFEHMEGDAAQTWQVIRSEFDKMLLDHAESSGVTVFQETEARSLVRDDNDTVIGFDAVDANGDTMSLRAPITIDASGRNCFSMVRNRWREADPRLKKIAMWAYYKNGKRGEGIDEGATTIAYAPCGGWFWYIPLPDNQVSVGVVGDRNALLGAEKDPETILNREIANTPWIADQLTEAERVTETKMTADYSYRARHCAEDGLLLAGDAFAFLDPVFSTGLFLALRSGEMAADAVNAALAANNCQATAFQQYGDELCASIEALRKLVYVFYDENFSFRDVIKKYPHLKGPLTDCLIGNVEGDLSELWSAIGEFVPVPEELPYGRPV